MSKVVANEVEPFSGDDVTINAKTKTDTLKPITGDHIDMEGKGFSNFEIKDVAEPGSVTADITSGVCTLDYELGGVQTISLTEDITSFTFSNWPSGKGAGMTLYFEQDATGGRSVDFSQFRTPGGNGVAIASDANAVDVVSVITKDGSTFDAGLAMGALA